MSAETEQLYKMIEKQESKIEDTNKAIGNLATEINQLVKVLAQKEVSDQNITRRIDDADSRINNHAERIRTLETVSAGVQAERKLAEYVWKAAITIVVGVVLYGAFKAYGG